MNSHLLNAVIIREEYYTISPTIHTINVLATQLWFVNITAAPASHDINKNVEEKKLTNKNPELDSKLQRNLHISSSSVFVPTLETKFTSQTQTHAGRAHQNASELSHRKKNKTLLPVGQMAYNTNGSNNNNNTWSARC